MKCERTHAVLFGFLVVLLTSLAGTSADAEVRTLAWTEYLDKVHGARLGECIGVTLGTPWEFRVDYPNDIITSYESGRLGGMPDGTPEQDDILTELAVLAGLREVGPAVDYEAMTRVWREHVPVRAVYCAAKLALEAMEEEIQAPESGHPRYNAQWHIINAQIEGELMGLLTPGMAHASRKYASMMAHVDNFAEGADGGIFVAACMSEAFLETDVERLIRKALQSIHPDSRYAHVVRDMLKWHAQHDDWHDARDLLARHYQDHGPISAVLNGGAVVLALLYGNGEFGKTICIATMAGWDSDCNPATAGAILGCMLGARAIPEQWSDPIRNTYHNRSVKAYPAVVKLDALALETALLGERFVQANGGKVVGDGDERVLHLPVQEYAVAELLEEVTGLRAERFLDHFHKWRATFTPRWMIEGLETWNPDWTAEIDRTWTGEKSAISSPGLRAPGPYPIYMPAAYGLTDVLATLRGSNQLPLAFVPKHGATVESGGALRAHVAAARIPGRKVCGDLLVRILVNGVVKAEQVVRAPEGPAPRPVVVACQVEAGDSVRIQAGHTGPTNAGVGILIDKIELVK